MSLRGCVFVKDSITSNNNIDISLLLTGDLRALEQVMSQFSKSLFLRSTRMLVLFASHSEVYESKC